MMEAKEFEEPNHESYIREESCTAEITGEQEYDGFKIEANGLLRNESEHSRYESYKTKISGQEESNMMDAKEFENLKLESCNQEESCKAEMRGEESVDLLKVILSYT